MAPSPMTHRHCWSSPARSRATAMPSPAEIEVEECAAPNGSYSLSARLVKPERPPPWRKRPDAVAPAGQDLVRIGLMADIPDQPVARRVEDVVQRDRQLDDAEAGAEMAAGDARRRRSSRRAVPLRVAEVDPPANGGGSPERKPSPEVASRRAKDDPQSRRELTVEAPFIGHKGRRGVGQSRAPLLLDSSFTGYMGLKPASSRVGRHLRPGVRRAG